MSRGSRLAPPRVPSGKIPMEAAIEVSARPPSCDKMRKGPVGKSEKEEMNMAQERTGVVTFKGNPVTLVGNEVKVGDTAPDFTVLANDLSPVTLADSKGSVRIISVVPSLDTGVCDQQTRRFNEEAASLEGVRVLTISVDLPFAQKRWCGAAGVGHHRGQLRERPALSLVVG